MDIVHSLAKEIMRGWSIHQMKKGWGCWDSSSLEKRKLRGILSVHTYTWYREYTERLWHIHPGDTHLDMAPCSLL